MHTQNQQFGGDGQVTDLPSNPPSTTSKPPNWVQLLDQPLHSERKLRLVCVGAGFAGLILAHKIKYDWKMDNFIDFQIYEKNPDVGGTWYENRYPGVACDVPAHSYVFPFEPNPNWSTFYAGGREIWQYIKDASMKWGLQEFVKFNAKVTDSIWDEASGKWKVKMTQEGKVIDDECDVLVNASGFLKDDTYDWSGKTVAIIGNGSSAVQLVPQLRKTAKKVVNYVRNPTWVSANWLEEFSDGGNHYSEEKRKHFRDNPEVLYDLRKKLEDGFNRYFLAALDGTPEQIGTQAAVQKTMEGRLGNDPELIKKFVPKFKVGCRRLSPGDGYLEALQQENTSTIWTPITKITEKGVLTADGEEEYDMVVTATGFDVSFRPSWNLVGQNGASLAKEWGEDAESYFGMCAVDHPNYFIFTGPNSPVAHGVLTSSMDAMSAYILRWCRKIATEDIKYVSVKKQVVRDLSVWSQELLSKTVWADDCTSWYKNGKVQGKITALHAGSVIHYREILQDVRGEDFDIEYRSANRFRYLGNGLTKRDVNREDLAYYFPPRPEGKNLTSNDM
ncbi:hypothetical protein ACEPPN_005867 [Leptodophora sp. 'Broadleaf-Isolate-01']